VMFACQKKSISVTRSICLVLDEAKNNEKQRDGQRAVK